MKKTLSMAALAALLGIGTLVATAGSASAYVVCNGYGDCWHTDQQYTYGADVHAVSHPDDWYFHQNWSQDTQHHWRDYHEGRGYYRNGVWVVMPDHD
jgi:hypothetical protein